MLGNAVLRYFASKANYEVHGTVRNWSTVRELQSLAPQARVVAGVDVESLDSLTRMFATVQPDMVINCIGIGQLSVSYTHLTLPTTSRV